MDDIVRLKQDYLQTFNCAKEYFAKENKSFKDEIEEHLDEVYGAVLEYVLSYCKENRVYIENFDDYKIVYFLSICMYEVTENKNYLKSMLKILDILVKADSGSFVDKDMIFKMMLHIDSGTWRQKYGEYGIYSIFKACSKHLL